MSRLKTPCATPGANYTITTGPRGFTVSVETPETADLGALSDDDLTDFHALIHDYAEELAFMMIQQARLREGRFDTPAYIPNARVSDETHNAMEIVRRAAARLLAEDPSLGVDA